MPVVMERDHVTIILIDTGSGNDGTAKVTANVFCDNPGITFIGLGENIETMFMLFIAGSFCFFEGSTKNGFHFIQESGAEGIPKERVIEMLYIAPESVIAVSTFGDKTMDMRIPFKISSESMQGHNKARSKVFGLIHLEEQLRNNAGNCVEKAV